MQQRHAVTAIVRDDHSRLGADDLREVELNELLVPGKAVAPPLRLVREPVAREVQRADTEPPAQRAGDFQPAPAPGRPAADWKQHRSAGIAHLHLEYLHRTGVPLRRLP